MFGFSAISYFLPVAGSEWSVAQFVLKEEDTKDEGVKAVISNGFLHVLTKTKKYYSAKFNKETKGELKIEAEENLLV